MSDPTTCPMKAARAGRDKREVPATRRTKAPLVRRALTAALAGLAATAVTAAPGGAAPSNATALSGPVGKSDRKVLVIGIDGARWDTVRTLMAAGDAPNLKALAGSGIFTPINLPSNGTLDQTLSGPSWNTILRGVWENKHRVDSNSDCDYDHHETYPDFLTRAERERPSLSTFTAVTWANLATTASCGPYVSDEVDAKFHKAAGGDATTANETARYITANGPDAGFVQLDEVDLVGHDDGGTSPAYLDAIEEADREVGKMIAAIRARPTLSEHWQVLVTTDHGHADAGGHGGGSAEERTAWVIGAELGAKSGGLPAQASVLPGSVRSTDLAPTALAHLGVAAKPEWQIDGRPLSDTGSDPFDTLAQRLGPAVDETPDPFASGPGLLYGFTHTAPAGWSVTTNASTGGVTEWRGWSFTTDSFWTSAATQLREEFGGGRSVIAVADGDEFADEPGGPGTLDTTLTSPGYPVAGQASVRLSFENYYRQESEQTAKVTVSFDGGMQRSVLRYGSTAADANAGDDVQSKRVSLPVSVPAGAQRMVVRWHYTGGNDWFWAIDDPQVTPASQTPPTGGAPVVSGGVYQIANAGSGKLVDDPASSQTAGTQADPVRGQRRRSKPEVDVHRQRRRHVRRQERVQQHVHGRVRRLQDGRRRDHPVALPR